LQFHGKLALRPAFAFAQRSHLRSDDI
jgi:hypothetical protein